MRQIVLDTETTGLDPSEGHRVIEIGCVELVNRRATGNNFHQYLNPEREIDEAAAEVHGITIEMLQDKPVFATIADDFLDYVREAELIIHNAPFDVGFLNHELTRIGRASMESACTILDSLELARRLHPGQRNNLDALCKRYDIDNTSRQLHGALLDAEILADVYRAMTGGQTTLSLDDFQPQRAQERTGRRSQRTGERPALRIVRANAQELRAHQRRLDTIDEACGGMCRWKKMGDEG